MADEFIGEVVIRGVNSKGRVFRPSDWAERLASVVSVFGKDNRLNYCPSVQPISRDGVRCVIISRSLEKSDPQVFRFLMEFASDNDLEVQDGRQDER